MSFQAFQVPFFEKLYSELALSPATPLIQEIMSSINSSQSTHLIFTNLSSGETLEGAFYLEKNLLVHQVGTLELPKIVLDLAYARLHTIFRCNQKTPSRKIYVEKNQNTYEIMFGNQADYDYWMLNLKKVCILTNFEKKYQVTEVTKIKGDISECLLEATMGGTHYSARRFDKKHLIASENSLPMIHLLNEIEILRVLKKKRVIKLHEVHETEDSIYLITDIFHDLTLKKMLNETSAPFSVAKTKTLLCQLLKVLAHMASKKIIHKNLKPSNILMEDKYNLIITNFGLATYENAPKANIGICGTPGYIAPEILNFQNENRVYNDKTDVFSAGCIFFEMLLGYPLFKASKASEIIYLNKHFKYANLEQLVAKEQNNPRPHSTKLGLNLLLKLLQDDPKQRISAEEALHDVYFETRDQAPPKKLSADESDSSSQNDKRKSCSGTPKSHRPKQSFDASSNGSNSLRGSFLEVGNHREASTLIPLTTSLKRLSEDNSGKCISPSLFKNQPKFKSAEEMKLPSPPKRLNEKISSEILILQKINFARQNDEEGCSDIFDESSSPMCLPNNCPITSPGIKKQPSQRF